MRFVVTLCTAFLLFLGVSSAYATIVPASPYFSEAYSPGEQHGGPYDCPISGRFWVVNAFNKSASKLGKSIFINGNGGWIGAVEDATTQTFLYRPDLEGVFKKGSVKNTSSVTYSGYGVPGYEDQHFCV